MPVTTIETRRTDWLSLDGVSPFRIWKQFDGLRWFQRHEWRKADGSVEMDEWIPSFGPWSKGMNEALTMAAPTA